MHRGLLASQDLGLDEETRRQRGPPHLCGGLGARIGVLDPRHDVDHARARIDLALGANDAPLPRVASTCELGVEPYLGPALGYAVGLVELGQVDEGEL